MVKIKKLMSLERFANTKLFFFFRIDWQLTDLLTASGFELMRRFHFCLGLYWGIGFPVFFFFGQ